MSEASEESQFKFGNQAWKARSSHGRNPKFEDSDVLESACEGYFEWVSDNPLMVVELAKYQGSATKVSVPRMRAMTIAGLCNYLDIGISTWKAYKKKSDFQAVTERVESIIYQQKFEGAAADLLNANIISRELGLADKNQMQHSGDLAKATVRTVEIPAKHPLPDENGNRLPNRDSECDNDQ